MKKYFFAFVVVAIAIAAWWVNSYVFSVETYQGDEFSFKYSNQLLIELENEDELRLSHAKEPDLLVVRTSVQRGGIEEASNILGVSAQEVVFDDIERAARVKYPEITVISKQKQDYAGRPGVWFEFTYKSPAGPLVQQKIIAILFELDSVLQISFQSKEADWAMVEQDYFSLVQSSLSFTD